MIMEAYEHIQHIIDWPAKNKNDKHSLQLWNDFNGTHLLPALTRMIACLPPSPSPVVLYHIRLISRAIGPIYTQLGEPFYNHLQHSNMYLESYLRAADLSALASVHPDFSEREEVLL